MKARSGTRDRALAALEAENRRLWREMEQCSAEMKPELEAEYAANIRRIEKIGAMDAGGHRAFGGVTGLGSPRMADQEGEPEDWRARVNGVLEDVSSQADPSGKYGFLEPGEYGDFDQ